MRIPIIAGNWKMNKTISESTYLVNEIKESHLREDVEVVVAVPFTSLTEVKKAIEGTRIKLAAQNMHWEGQGAYTGEISPLMLKEIGIDYCIIGHSERRQYFNETDETVNKSNSCFKLQHKAHNLRRRNSRTEEKNEEERL